MDNEQMTVGQEVWLYGSWARGDADAKSDVDILIAQSGRVTDHSDSPHIAMGAIAMTTYSWDEIENMVGYGSLFMHHLKLEGKPLMETPDRKLHHLLAQLGPYIYARRDVESFETTLRDIEESLANYGSPLFEASVLGTVLRHSSILGCYLVGQPCFARLEPILKLGTILNARNEHVQQMLNISLFRLSDSRGIETESQPTTDQVLQWSFLVRKHLLQIKELADEFERVGVSRTA